MQHLYLSTFYVVIVSREVVKQHKEEVWYVYVDKWYVHHCACTDVSGYIYIYIYTHIFDYLYLFICMCIYTYIYIHNSHTYTSWLERATSTTTVAATWSQATHRITWSRLASLMWRVMGLEGEADFDHNGGKAIFWTTHLGMAHTTYLLWFFWDGSYYCFTNINNINHKS